MKKKILPTRERILEVLDYDPITGVFTWKADSSRPGQWAKWVGKVAGAKKVRQSDGTSVGMRLAIDGTDYALHRLAWVVMTGENDFDHEVDHINLNAHDNRWSNLRRATHGENAMNRRIQPNGSTGLKGVRFISRPNNNLARPWYAVIQANGKTISLGYHATKGLAAVARAKAALRYHGQFARPC